tara:strand:+ start:7173 stop:7838 length:666 start_codon:yes stop_codon:yes gene_type:complete
MNGIWLILAITLLTIWGLIKQAFELKKLNADAAFAGNFLEKLKSYWESGGRDGEAYTWLIHRSYKMQANLGAIGILEGYSPPYQNVMYRQYPIVLNVLPELRRVLGDELLSKHLAEDYVHLLRDTCIRSLGVIDDRQESLSKDLKNPVIWFRTGIRDLMALPAYLLSWVGLIKPQTTEKILASILFSMVSGLMSLLSILSAIITVAIGWETFSKLVSRIFS